MVLANEIKLYMFFSELPLGCFPLFLMLKTYVEENGL